MIFWLIGGVAMKGGRVDSSAIHPLPPSMAVMALNPGVGRQDIAPNDKLAVAVEREVAEECSGIGHDAGGR
jgi:hypothetical protein